MTSKPGSVNQMLNLNNLTDARCPRVVVPPSELVAGLPPTGHHTSVYCPGKILDGTCLDEAHFSISSFSFALIRLMNFVKSHFWGSGM
jgi:hypothetical protein